MKDLSPPPPQKKKSKGSKSKQKKAKRSRSGSTGTGGTGATAAASAASGSNIAVGAASSLEPYLLKPPKNSMERYGVAVVDVVVAAAKIGPVVENAVANQPCFSTTHFFLSPRLTSISP
jgi:hypothetical protein